MLSSHESETNRFYTDLTPIKVFSKIFSSGVFEDLPEDWILIFAEVEGSRAAVEEGRSRSVNIAGCLPVMAMANLAGDLGFPFVLRGNGMTALVPQTLHAEAKDILADVRQIVRELYSLELRVGIIPSKDIYKSGHRIQVAKFRVSPFFDQAFLDGSGMDLAEKIWNSPEEVQKYLIAPDHRPKKRADFMGFSCRWKEISCPKDETVSLILKVRSPAKEDRMVCANLLTEIENILGSQYLPLSPEGLKYSLDSQILRNESMVLAKKRRGFGIWLATVGIKFQIVFSSVMEFFRVPMRQDWRILSQIKNFIMLSSDYRKYDGQLKMVVSVTSETRQILEGYLEQIYKDGLVNYGLHSSDSAVMTSLVHAKSRREVHFIDSSNGGFVMAEVKLKAQIEQSA